MPRETKEKTLKQTCPQCGHKDLLGRKSGLCLQCSTKKTAENYKQLRQKKGPFYDKWKNSLILFLQESK